MKDVWSAQGGWFGTLFLLGISMIERWKMCGGSCYAYVRRKCMEMYDIVHGWRQRMVISQSSLWS